MDRPLFGVRLDGPLTGCLVRHSGHDRKITILWRPDEARGRARFLMVSFGGYDWMGNAMTRL